MTLPDPQNEMDAAYYAARRDKARSLADAARDPAIQTIHQRMAERYDQLARRDAGQSGAMGRGR